jgi:inosine/xanthosine triphosphatase
MTVAIGSKNPTKLAAVERAFSDFFHDERINFTSAETESGVSEQPMSIQETIQGAVNRAIMSVRGGADYSVGIEGGLSFHDINGDERGIEISFVCVLDCKSGIYEIASCHGFGVFPRVLKHVRTGKSLSDAMDKEYGITEIGKNNGYIGWLSDNTITRESSAYDAVYLALSALSKEERL